MDMTKDIVEALRNQNEAELYHALYDLYDKGSAEAVEAFKQWKSEVNVYEKAMIMKAERRIYKNETFITSMF